LEIISFLDSARWLTVYELVLCLLHLIILIRYAIPLQSRFRWLNYIPGAGVLISIASYLEGDATLPALVLYALSLIIFLCTIRQIWRPVPIKVGLKRRIWRSALIVCGILPIIFVFLVAGEMRYNPVSNFSEMSYSKAFIEMNHRLSVEYPFGDWKRMDWDALKNTYEPQFALADEERDTGLYYKALRDYLASLHDGHIKIVNEQLYDNPVFQGEVGGGFGIRKLEEQHVKGLILDLRNNPGGEDQLAAEMTGNFASTEKLYEQVSYYNRYSKAYELNQLETIWVKPSKNVYTGKIAVLINNRTGSSAEGIPLMLKGQPNVIIVGFNATSGSFGVISRPITIHLPEGYIIEFPDGRSLNQDKEVQLESNNKVEGGAAPDLRIPLTEQTFIDKYINGKDVEVDNAVAALELLDSN
jgi:hypothetical protein